MGRSRPVGGDGLRLVRRCASIHAAVIAERETTMSRLGRWLVSTFAGLLAAAPGALAAPAEGPHEIVDVSYSTTAPGMPAAIHFSASYRDPANPSGPPPALRRVTIVGPNGAVLDTSAVPLCR